MTPTLFGRWQTRIAMLGTWGALVTLLFALFYSSEDGFVETFFYVLGYVAGFGLVWDILWILLQRFRWDRDWPAAFQIASAVVEGALVIALIRTTGLPGIEKDTVSLGLFTSHYGLAWFATFIWVQGPMRALLPRWRYSGGRIV